MWTTSPSPWVNPTLAAAKSKPFQPRVFGLSTMININMVMVMIITMVIMIMIRSQVCCSWQRDKLLQPEESDRWSRVRERKNMKLPHKKYHLTPCRAPITAWMCDYLQVKQWQRVFRGDLQQEMHSVRCEGLFPVLSLDVNTFKHGLKTFFISMMWGTVPDSNTISACCCWSFPILHHGTSSHGGRRTICE